MMLSSCSLLRAISAYYLFANPKQPKTEDNNRSWYHVWLHQGQPMDSTTWPGNMPNHSQSHSFLARRGFQHWVGKYSLPFIFRGPCHRVCTASGIDRFLATLPSSLTLRPLVSVLVSVLVYEGQGYFSDTPVLDPWWRLRLGCLFRQCTHCFTHQSTELISFKLVVWFS